MTVQFFDSMEELQETLRENQRRADARIEDWQREVKPGDKVIRLAEMNAGPLRRLLLIYGEIIDPIEAERPHYDLTQPEEQAEFNYVCQRYAGEWSESFCFGRFYSTLCSEGEYGDIHRSTITSIISDEEFEEYRKAGWPQP